MNTRSRLFSIPVLAAAFLFSGPILLAQNTPREYEADRRRFLANFFAQPVTPDAAAVKNNLLPLIEKELSSLRFAHQALPALNAASRQMLDEINGLTPLPEDSLERARRLEHLERFKTAHLRRLLAPWKSLQRKLDENPKLRAYAFRPTADALHTRERFIISRPGTPARTASVRAILQALFSLRGPDAPRAAWNAEPAEIRQCARRAALSFAPAVPGGPRLEIRVDFDARIIRADITPSP